jgi:hypothetical protein
VLETELSILACWLGRDAVQGCVDDVADEPVVERGVLIRRSIRTGERVLPVMQRCALRRRTGVVPTATVYARREEIQHRY